MAAVRRMTDLPVEFHGHNDLGLATANTIAAIGGRRPAAASVAVNGLGERAGNAALEQVATRRWTRCSGTCTAFICRR